MKPDGDVLRRHEWEVVDVPLDSAQRMVARLHYAGGGSNTAAYVHGLVRRNDPMRVRGIAWWLPPTRVAAESVEAEHWREVLALTRLVIEPDVPANAASFLLSGSVRRIRADGRWRTLLTYADEAQGHTGAIYRAANWDYVGRTGPYPRWEDEEGRQVAPKATINRTRGEMEALGHRLIGRAWVHKFVLQLGVPSKRNAPQKALF